MRWLPESWARKTSEERKGGSKIRWRASHARIYHLHPAWGLLAVIVYLQDRADLRSSELSEEGLEAPHAAYTILRGGETTEGHFREINKVRGWIVLRFRIVPTGGLSMLSNRETNVLYHARDVL